MLPVTLRGILHAPTQSLSISVCRFLASGEGHWETTAQVCGTSCLPVLQIPRSVSLGLERSAPLHQPSNLGRSFQGPEFRPLRRRNGVWSAMRSAMVSALSMMCVARLKQDELTIIVHELLLAFICLLSTQHYYMQCWGPVHYEPDDKYKRSRLLPLLCW